MYWITGVLGVVLALSPFILGYSDNASALWASILVGAAIIGLSWTEGIYEGRNMWEYWAAAILGLAAIVAPFLLGFGSHLSAMPTMVFMGLLIALLAGSKVLTGQTHKV